jgi:hypothetical protein
VRLAQEGNVDTQPRPLGDIDTSQVKLPDYIHRLTEQLASHIHDIWSRHRLAEGWRYGPHRDDQHKEHPGLVPYDQLPSSERDYDRNTALETLKAILALGYQILPPASASPSGGAANEK